MHKTDKLGYIQSFRLILFTILILVSSSNKISASGGIEESNPALSKLQPDPQLQHWILNTIQNLLGQELVSQELLEELETMKVQAPAMYKYHKTNHNLYYDMAREGHPDVMALLAANFHFGRGTIVNPVKALRWFIQSAEKDNLQSQLATSLYFLSGRALQKDLKQAKYWLKRASEQGSNLANEILQITKPVRELVTKKTYNSHHTKDSSMTELGKVDDMNKVSTHTPDKDIENKLEIAQSLMSLPDPSEKADTIRKNLLDAFHEGSLEAGKILSEELLNGNILKSEPTLAVKILEELVKKGYFKALVNLGDLFFSGSGMKRNSQKAIHYYKLAAKRNLPEAQLKLGLINLEFTSETKGDRSAGLNYLKAASDNGSLEAQKLYAEEMLNSGKFSIAAKYLELAADQGDIDSMLSLAELGSQQSSKLHTIDSVYWYLQAALKGHNEAQYESGMLYIESKHVPQDFRLAYRWLLLAAQKGHINAQFQLGVLYSKGLGVPKNNYRAAKWYRKAALQSHKDAAAVLGTLYYDGIGVTQDFEKALHWFTKAAQQGDSEIQELLVRLYRGQMQISPDYVKAYAWANVLAENHEDHQQEVDKLRSYLSVDELRNAQELSLNHYAKIQKNNLMIN